MEALYALFAALLLCCTTTTIAAAAPFAAMPWETIKLNDGMMCFMRCVVVHTDAYVRQEPRSRPSRSALGRWAVVSSR